MKQEVFQSIVDKVVLEYHQRNQGLQSIPIAVSARHVHLSKEHVEKLFGDGFKLTRKADLSQPGQFAANETVTIAGPKGSIERVRILGPSRDASQVEVSRTDSFNLGLKPCLRESGDLKGSSPVTIIGPNGSIYLPEGLIIAHNHIHMTPDDAKLYKVENGEYVKVKVEGERAIVFDRVLIRISERYKLEMHIDTDEGNVALINSHGKGTLMKKEA